MTAAKHTPGPWRVGPVDDTRVEDANGNEVAQIDGDYNQPDTWPLMEANARLIAAAPDMLAALKAAKEADKINIARGGAAKFIEADQRAQRLIRAAIAKAEGSNA